MSQRARPSFGDAAILGALSSAIMALVTIVRSKVTALVLGPEGFGVTGEVMQYPMLASTLVAIVAGTALSSKLAAAHGRGDAEAARRIYSTALTALLALSVPGGIVATIVVGVLLAGAHGEVVWLYGLLSVFGLFGATLAGIPALVLAARGEAKAALGVSLVAGVVPGVVSVLPRVLRRPAGPVPRPGLPPRSSAWPWRFPWRRGSFPTSPGGRGGSWTAAISGRRCPSAGPRCWAACCCSGVLVLVRNLLIDRGGSALLGQFQASWAAGSAYLGLVLGGVASFAFPRYAAATTAQTARPGGGGRGPLRPQDRPTGDLPGHRRVRPADHRALQRALRSGDARPRLAAGGRSPQGPGLGHRGAAALPGEGARLPRRGGVLRPDLRPGAPGRAFRASGWRAWATRT